jgi:hypothetical protein
MSAFGGKADTILGKSGHQEMSADEPKANLWVSLTGLTVMSANDPYQSP